LLCELVGGGCDVAAGLVIAYFAVIAGVGGFEAWGFVDLAAAGVVTTMIPMSRPL